MKKIGIIAAILILAAIYLFADQTIEKESVISADHMIFENYAQALESSDAVVEVITTADRKNITSDKSGYLTGHTLTKVSITRVFEYKEKEQGQDELLEGEIIGVLEPTYTVDNGIKLGVTRYNYEDYTKMEEGLSYVLFLKWDNTRNAYWINALEQGKFNIGADDKRELELTGENSQYEQLKRDVMDQLYK